MTREEEIKKQAEKKALEPSRLMHPYAKQHKVMSAYEIGFIEGAVWADEHPHWVSVEDDLPKINPNGSEWEYSDDVLVAFKDGSIAVGRYERDNSTGEHYWWLYGVDKDLIVTHWMPMSQAPVLSNSENTGKDLKGGDQ